MSTPRQPLEFIPDPDAMVLRFRDLPAYDPLLLEELPSQLDQVVDSARGRLVIIDFSQMPFISSPVAGYLFLLHRRLLAIGSKLRFRHVSTNLRDVFRIISLDRLVPIDNDDPNDHNASSGLSA